MTANAIDPKMTHGDFVFRTALRANHDPILRRQQFTKGPYMVGESCLLRRGDAQRFVYPAEIVIGDLKP